jgi:hypothetical protein
VATAALSGRTARQRRFFITLRVTVPLMAAGTHNVSLIDPSSSDLGIIPRATQPLRPGSVRLGVTRSRRLVIADT